MCSRIFASLRYDDLVCMDIEIKCFSRLRMILLETLKACIGIFLKGRGLFRTKTMDGKCLIVLQKD